MSETTLTSAEQAYFDSQGEKVPDATPAETPTDTTPAPAPSADEGTEQPPAKQVPLAALHEERERRKELQRTIDQERQARAAFEATVNERLRLLGQVAQPQPQQPAVPEFAQDPQGYIDGRLRNAEQAAREAKEAAQAQAIAIQEQRAVQAAVVHAQAQEAAFSATAPDYGAAMNYLRKVRIDELRHAAPLLGLAEGQIPGIVQNEIMQLAVAASRNPGVNFAEAMYGLAKQRGYQPKAAAPRPQPAESAENPLETVQRGQQLATGLGNAGGNAVPAKMTAERLAAMSEREFREYYEKNRSEADRLMDRG